MSFIRSHLNLGFSIISCHLGLGVDLECEGFAVLVGARGNHSGSFGIKVQGYSQNDRLLWINF